MAFPFILETNFENGTNSEWTSETDSASQLDIAHASTLAGVAGQGNLAPFRGAYCARWQLGANTTDAYFISTTIDIADAATAFFRWYMFLGTNLRATAADVVSIFKLTQAGAGTVEQTIGLNFDGAGGIFIGGSDGTAAAAFGTTNITLGQWHCIEVSSKISTADVGQIIIYLDGRAELTGTANLDAAAAVGDGALGIMDRLSTTTGTVLMDCFVMDDLRIYPIVDRYPRQVLLTKSAHLFVGPGMIENATLLDGSSTDSTLAIFDTNRANINDANKIVLELKGLLANDVIDPAGVPVQVQRGAYVVLGGTAPRAMVNIAWAPGYGSSAAVRNTAARLRMNPLEVF